MALVEAITGLTGYALWHATRAELLTRLDRAPEAADALRHALALPSNTAQRRLLEDRLATATP